MFLNCPRCGRKIRLPYRDRTLACPNCQAALLVRGTWVAYLLAFVIFFVLAEAIDWLFPSRYLSVPLGLACALAIFYLLLRRSGLIYFETLDNQGDRGQV